MSGPLRSGTNLFTGCSCRVAPRPEPGEQQTVLHEVEARPTALRPQKGDDEKSDLFQFQE